MSDNMSLSPWDLRGISFDLGVYRPRRPSYLYATQGNRRRNESYRHATKTEESNDNNDHDIEGFDFIEGMVQKKRKDSYKRATKAEDIEMDNLDPNGGEPSSNHVGVTIDGATCETRAGQPGIPLNQEDDSVFYSSSEENVMYSASKWKYRKNFAIICVSFILVFTAFRSVQNLQTSLNHPGRLGTIAMTCVHGTMFITCLFAPAFINKLTAKWTMVLGLMFYALWIAANLYPHFYTLIPTSIGVGLGQTLAWTSQVSYISRLATDYAHVSKEISDHEIYKFNGIFLACFQTTHIWGNLVSSLMLGDWSHPRNWTVKSPGFTYCGVYDPCVDEVPSLRNITETGKYLLIPSPNKSLNTYGLLGSS